MSTEMKLKVPADSPMVYSNAAFVQNTPTEIVIRFCMIDPMRGENEPNPDQPEALLSVEAPAVVSVFLVPGVAERLASAINDRVEAWKKQTAGGD